MIGTDEIGLRGPTAPVSLLVAALLGTTAIGCCDTAPPTPGEEIASATAEYIPELLLSDNRIYYLVESNGVFGGRGVFSKPKIPGASTPSDGGEPTDSRVYHAASDSTPSRLFMSGDTLAWFEQGTACAVRASRRNPHQVVHSGWNYDGPPVAYDGERLYFGHGDGFHAARAGVTPPDRLCDATWQFLGRSASLDDTYVYVTPYEPRDLINNTSSVVRIPKKGGAPTTLVRDRRGILSIAVDDTHVYWAATGSYDVDSSEDCPSKPLGYRNDGELGRVPKAGGAPQVLADGLRWPKNLRVDEGHVYFVTDGKLTKVPKGGGAVADVLPAQPPTRVIAFAVDSTHVYWSNPYGQILRIAK